jgi:hypothetical protein
MKKHTTIYIIVLMMISNLALAAVYTPGKLSTIKFETTSESQLVKATIVDGELIPVVDLPVVEIVAEGKSKIYLPVKIVDGKMIAVIDLPEVEITESSFNRNIEDNNEPVAFVNLPEINITGKSKKDNMLKRSVNTEGTITLIASLPEITVYGYILNADVQPPLTVNKGLSFEPAYSSCESILFPGKVNKLMAYFQSKQACKEYKNIKVNLTIQKKKNGMVILVDDEKYFIPGNIQSFKIEEDMYVN